MTRPGRLRAVVHVTRGMFAVLYRWPLARVGPRQPVFMIRRDANGEIVTGFSAHDSTVTPGDDAPPD